MIEKAILVAAEAHKGQVRKGTLTPYITHPFTVGMMLAQAGCSNEVVAAGILHDTVEDTYVTLDHIREQFGSRVASIVEGCSEPNKTDTWEERKQHTIEYLRTAPWEVRLVSCADKLHNLRTIAEVQSKIGDEVWLRFKRGREQQEWYYRSLLTVLCGPAAEGPPLPFCAEFGELVRRVFGSLRT
jgi:(p)ppGpp synthase/HD superfamily hydrolase